MTSSDPLQTDTNLQGRPEQTSLAFQSELSAKCQKPEWTRIHFPQAVTWNSHLVTSWTGLWSHARPHK